MIGQVLSGNYRLSDLVGSGGYADVYLARAGTNATMALACPCPFLSRLPVKSGSRDARSGALPS